ncbi:MAG: hypothetical protein ACK4OO_03445 [bacterium]
MDYVGRREHGIDPKKIVWMPVADHLSIDFEEPSLNERRFLVVLGYFI